MQEWALTTLPSNGSLPLNTSPPTSCPGCKALFLRQPHHRLRGGKDRGGDIGGIHIFFFQDVSGESHMFGDSSSLALPVGARYPLDYGGSSVEHIVHAQLNFGCFLGGLPGSQYLPLPDWVCLRSRLQRSRAACCGHHQLGCRGGCPSPPPYTTDLQGLQPFIQVLSHYLERAFPQSSRTRLERLSFLLHLRFLPPLTASTSLLVPASFFFTSPLLMDLWSSSLSVLMDARTSPVQLSTPTDPAIAHN